MAGLVCAQIKFAALSGAAVLYSTELSVLVEIVFVFPAESLTAPAAIEGMSVPFTAAVAFKLQILLLEVVRVQVMPVAVPP
ncbi:hypothetical protein D3C87_1602560 [compost metagenome]